MALRLIRSICFTLFVAGIPALIVSSIRGNNAGWVITFGMITAFAAVILIAVSATTSTKRIDAFDDVVAERVEQRIRTLVEAGANETEVRSLVRDTIDLSRGQQ
jgi:metal-dependent amidase/aminoacylase/carboxypeptidase family protein